MLWVFIQFVLFSSSAVWSSWNAICKNDYKSSNSVVIPVPLSKYTEPEANALQQFRVLISDSIVREYEKHDSFLINWLRAKHLNLNEAAAMFIEAQKWRIDNHIDTIINETIFKFNPPLYTIDGFDKKNHPIIIITPAHTDTRKLIIQGGRNKVVRLFYQILEKSFIQTRVASKMFQKNITKVTVILDLHNYDVRQHICLACVSVYKDWFIGMEKYYPEMAEHCVIINIPRIAIPLIRIIRPILSENTNKVLKLFSSDRRDWSTFFNEIISTDQLPYTHGGTRGRK